MVPGGSAESRDHRLWRGSRQGHRQGPHPCSATLGQPGPQGEDQGTGTGPPGSPAQGPATLGPRALQGELPPTPGHDQGPPMKEGVSRAWTLSHRAPGAVRGGQRLSPTRGPGSQSPVPRPLCRQRGPRTTAGRPRASAGSPGGDTRLGPSAGQHGLRSGGAPLAAFAGQEGHGCHRPHPAPPPPRCTPAAPASHALSVFQTPKRRICSPWSQNVKPRSKATP